MPLDAVLFDLDDTLHDKSATLRAFGLSQLARLTLADSHLSPDFWMERFITLNNQRIPKSEVFDVLASDFGLTKALRDELLLDFDNNLGAAAVPYPGAVELVRGCKALGLKTGIVTNGREEFQRSKIAGMGLDPYLDCTVTSGGLGIKKPDHEIFLAATAALRTTPGACIFVGDDMAADILPAVALGMRAIWKSTASSRPDAFASDSLQEVLAYIRSAV